MRSLFARPLRLWILFITSWCTGTVYGSPVIATEITYSCTGTPNLYNVTLKLYRECSASSSFCGCPTSLNSGCTINVNITVAGSCASSYFGTQALTIVPASSALDVTELCKTSKSLCSNCGTRTPGSFSPGIEVYTFTGQVNLSSVPASCCMVSINYSTCCHNPANTVIAGSSSIPYYNEAVINRCITPCNSSPIFKSPVKHILNNGSDAMLNVVAIDPDGDSLSYAFAPSLSAQGTSVSYISPYSATVPLPYLGAPITSPPAAFPVGISMNSLTGDVGFRPFGNFVANLAVEVKQWKYVAGVATLAGISRRDNELWSVNTPTSSVAVKKCDSTGVNLGGFSGGGDNITICENTRFCRIYVAVDAATADTTDLGWFADAMPSATFEKLYVDSTRHINGPRQDSVKFCWTPPAGSARGMPYLLYCKFANRNCNLPLSQVRAFTIYVSPNSPPAAVINKVQNSSTHAYQFTYTPTNGVVPVTSQTQWEIETRPHSDTFVTINSNAVASYLFSQFGTYKIRLHLSSPCNNSVLTDSVSFSYLTMSISGKTNISCRGVNTGQVILSAVNGKGTVLYAVNGNYQVSPAFNNLAAGTYRARVKDSQNFTDSADFEITQPDSMIRLTLGSKTDLTCNGDTNGTVVLSAFNGTGALQYNAGSGTFQSSNMFINRRAGATNYSVKDSLNCTAIIIVTITQPAAITLQATSLIHVKCYGDSTGSATLTATNGRPPYLYKSAFTVFQSGNIINGLKAGSQLFTVKDSNNCQATKQASITQPNALVPAVLVNQPKCAGDLGSIVVTTSGGVGPYTYNIDHGSFGSSGSFQGLMPGSYALSVKDQNNCLAERTAAVPDSPLVVTAVVDHVTCKGANNGKITLAGTNGKPPYQYKVGAKPYSTVNVFSNLGPGTYLFAAIDSNGCSLFLSATVNEPDALLLTSLTATQASCNTLLNGSCTATVWGGKPPYTLLWNTSPPQTAYHAVNLPAGYAKLRVTDSVGCVKKDSILVSYKTPYSDEQICLVSTDTLTGKNIIAWNKTPDVGTAAYKVYAGASAGGSFSEIANQPYGAAGVITDALSTGNKPVYYYLKVVDSCANESAAGRTYASVHVDAQATGNQVMLEWNSYSAAAVAAVTVKRSVDNGPFIAIASLSTTDISFTDVGVPAGSKKYLVDYTLNQSCTPQGFSHIYSNQANVISNGVNQTSSSQGITAYPNPAQHMVTFKSLNAGNYISTIEMVSLPGALVKRETAAPQTYEAIIDISGLDDGIYQAIITCSNNLKMVKMIVVDQHH